MHVDWIRLSENAVFHYNSLAVMIMRGEMHHLGRTSFANFILIKMLRVLYIDILMNVIFHC